MSFSFFSSHTAVLTSFYWQWKDLRLLLQFLGSSDIGLYEMNYEKINQWALFEILAFSFGNFTYFIWLFSMARKGLLSYTTSNCFIDFFVNMFLIDFQSMFIWQIEYDALIELFLKRIRIALWIFFYFWVKNCNDRNFATEITQPLA